LPSRFPLCHHADLNICAPPSPVFAIALTGNEVKILLSRLEYLQQQQIESDFVFRGSGRTGHLQDIKKRWISPAVSIWRHPLP